MLNILGYTYRVMLHGTRDELGAMGKTSMAEQKIYLADNMAEDALISTLLHEILEGINSHLELNVPHPAISALEVGIYQSLTANGVDLSILKETIEGR